MSVECPLLGYTCCFPYVEIEVRCSVLTSHQGWLSQHEVPVGADISHLAVVSARFPPVKPPWFFLISVLCSLEGSHVLPAWGMRKSVSRPLRREPLHNLSGNLLQCLCPPCSPGWSVTCFYQDGSTSTLYMLEALWPLWPSPPAFFSSSLLPDSPAHLALAQQPAIPAKTQFLLSDNTIRSQALLPGG